MGLLDEYLSEANDYIRRCDARLRSRLSDLHRSHTEGDRYRMLSFNSQLEHMAVRTPERAVTTSRPADVDALVDKLLAGVEP